jgi:hypothetical protein
MNSEILRRVPIYSRKTMELAFADAEKRRAKIRSGDGSKGGRPRRGDVLQGLIEEIVSARPAISASDLLEQLREFQYQGVVTDIEDHKRWPRTAPFTSMAVGELRRVTLSLHSSLLYLVFRSDEDS